MKGFSLAEVLVAMALLTTSALGLAALFSVSSQMTQASRVDTVATLAAEAKMAELRALTLAYDAAGTGAPISDARLAISPASALVADSNGFVDYVDAAGVVVGAGTQQRLGLYIRRWSIEPLPADPANAVVLQVVATRATRPAAREVHLVSILARTAQ